MNVTDQQVLAAQDEFWNELRHWRILPIRDGSKTKYKALRDQLIGEDKAEWMDQDSEDAARMYIQFRSLKAAIESINLEETPTGG